MKKFEHDTTVLQGHYLELAVSLTKIQSGVPRGEFGGVQNPPEIPKALQNRAKLKPILWKLLKIAEFRTPTPQDVRKKGSKILKLPRFAIVLH